MDNTHQLPLIVEDYPASRPSLRIAVVTETWPPEVNGVAVTLAKLVQGLCLKNHDLQLIRPRQDKFDSAIRDSSLKEVLMRGMPIPHSPDVKLGFAGRKSFETASHLRFSD